MCWLPVENIVNKNSLLPKNLNAHQSKSKKRAYDIFWSKCGFPNKEPSQEWKTDIG